MEKEIKYVTINYDMSIFTPINVDRLELLELAEHPDSSQICYLISDFKQGFDTGIETLQEIFIECKNLLSARSQPECVTKLVISYKSIGIAEGNYSKKKRLVVDLSAPHDDELNPSLNDLIDLEEFSLNYVTIDDAINLIKL